MQFRVSFKENPTIMNVMKFLRKEKESIYLKLSNKIYISYIFNL